MRESGDGSIREPPRRRKWPYRTQSGDPALKELYIARNLVRDRLEVPVRALNAIRRDRKLTKGFPLAHYETVTLVTPPDV
jgi:hypothetical protein